MFLYTKYRDRNGHTAEVLPMAAGPASAGKVLLMSVCLLIGINSTSAAAKSCGHLPATASLPGSFSDTAAPGGWYTVFVSPDGVDADISLPATGTKAHPLRTIAMAIRRAREARRLRWNYSAEGQPQGVKILLEDGLYQPENTIVIRPEDGGTRMAPTRLEALHEGRAVVSGGRTVTGWMPLCEQDPLYDQFPAKVRPSVYVARLPREQGTLLNFRQLWVDGHKAVRAESLNGGSYGSHMQRILSWDHQDQSCWIPKPAGFDLEQAAGMEMLIHQWWAVANLRIKKATVSGDRVQLHFYAPESRLESEHPWPAPWLSEKTGNSAFYLTNGACFMDTAAEWYLDQQRQRLYYIPRKGEDLRGDRSAVVIPRLTTLLRVAGSNEQPVTHFQIRGLTFSYSTWLRPSRKGHVPLQAGMYLLEAYKLKTPGTPEKAGLENQAWIGRPPGAVEVQFSSQLQIKDCRFLHLASTGLDLMKGTRGSLIEGNLVKDVGGTGIQIGVYSPPDYETHLPYNPANKNLLCRYDTIRNNLVTDVTNEDWGCVGISAGVVHHELIAHNEVSDVSYSGICVGWGWTKRISALAENKILCNKVTHYAKRMYDVGGLYTLSAQPGTLIQGNCIDSIYKAPYPHDPEHWFYYYLDEGSSYITIKDNWSPALKVMKNANGPGNTWENDGPGVADSIKSQAGLEPSYRYLLKERVVDADWPVQPVPAEDKIKTNGN